MADHKVIAQINSVLFEPEMRRLNETIIRINRRNKELTRTQTDGFLYLGDIYRPKTGTLLIGARLGGTKPLHPALIPEMREHMQDASEVWNDRQIINQTLLLLIGPCKHWSEIRDALPECLVCCVPQLAAMNRSRTAAYTIEDNPMALRQYVKTLPKMEVYSTARLLY